LGISVRLNTTLQSPDKVAQRNALNRNPKTRNAFIALGSNMGNRLQTIEAACKKIDLTDTTKVIRTSGLWDTEPMYVKNQDRFLNGVCEVGSPQLKSLYSFTDLRKG
jgi:2-amino-4-hydroxy-6-hydroxymethyldihydropteridine diphosphokinase/dihydropteroate synthase